MANSWRKGWFLNPFCHLVIKAVRVDSDISHFDCLADSVTILNVEARHEHVVEAGQIFFSIQKRLASRSLPS